MLKLSKLVVHGGVSGVCTKLKDRALLAVEGPETYRFLNGMVTQRLLDDELKKESFCAYGGFLSHKGKLLYDSLFYHRPAVRDFLVEVDKQNLEPLANHLNKYKLRSTIWFDKEISLVYDVWSVVCADEVSRNRLITNILNRSEFGSYLIQPDPRWPLLALRLVLPKSVEPPLREMPDVRFMDDAEFYNFVRLAHGIPENALELPPEKQMPLEANMEHLDGVAFDKGCYLGQELIARTHYTGEVHKRLFTFKVLNDWEPQDEVIASDPKQLIYRGLVDHTADIGLQAEQYQGKDILDQEGKKVGTIRSGASHLALGMLRCQALNPQGHYRIGDRKWKVILPHWWSNLNPSSTAQAEKH